MPSVRRRLVATALSLLLVGAATAAAVQASSVTLREAIWAAHGP
jgi:hypothetical protein